MKICCEHEAAEGGILCHSELAPGVHFARVDPARLMQIFWNLLKNAVKFTPRGGEIWIRSWVDESAALAVAFRDSGRGIAPEVLGQIFDAFEQGGRQVTREFGGLGLGLAISKAIVELHGGTIAAASEGLGRGSLFTVRLPLVAAPPTPPAPRLQPPAAERGAPAADVPVHLLLVEDHADTANILTRLLRRAGFHVTIARTCAEALAMAAAAPHELDGTGQAGPIQLVISDLGLPDGTGHELMHELRVKYGLRGLALSGYGMEEDIQRAREAGFVQHLTKPVDLDDLLSTIRGLI